MRNTPPEKMGAYVAAKSALWGISKVMSVEWAQHGITVNNVSPSPVLTEQWTDVSETRRRALAMKTPLRRVATVEDVAKAVLFFVGEGGNYLTGANLSVTGEEIM